MTSKYFHIVNGEGYDWKFLKRDDPNGGHSFNFFLCGALGTDDLYVGNVSHMGRHRQGWVAAPWFAPDGYKLVYGFISRFKATEHMLEVCHPKLEKILGGKMEEPGVFKRQCRDCEHEFETNDVLQDCPKCGGWTRSQPLFRNKKEWEDMMRWQG